MFDVLCSRCGDDMSGSFPLTHRIEGFLGDFNKGGLYLCIDCEDDMGGADVVMEWQDDVDAYLAGGA